MQLFPAQVLSVSDLVVTTTSDGLLVRSLVNAWHSCRRAPQGWRVAFLLTDGFHIYGVSTFGRPVARLEDQLTTLEHTRMALSTAAPRNAGTYFMAQSRKWIRDNMPDIKRLISYVPLELHSGIIYRGDNWKTVYWGKNSRHNWTNRPNRRSEIYTLKAKFERTP